MDYTTVLTEIRGRVGIVQLNRPQALNAFNTLMLTELFDALEGVRVRIGTRRSTRAGVSDRRSTVRMVL